MTPVGKIILQIDRMLDDYPELEDDADLRLDMIEGETDAMEVATRLVRTIRQSETTVDAIKAEIDMLKARSSRYATRKDRARAVLEGLMDAMGTVKLSLTVATITMSEGREKAIISDENMLPDGYMRIKKEPDKAAILEALKAGQAVPGAVLSNGGRTLTVRQK
jgi:phage host-nuclease inhibitor protein Gam